MGTMDLKTEGDRFVVVSRYFAAPPAEVYRAHMEPELVQQWMLGPEGWTMPVCINEGKVGGRIRYEWSNGEGGFYLTGEILELEPPHRIVHVERMFLPDPTPDNHIARATLAAALLMTQYEARIERSPTAPEHGMPPLHVTATSYGTGISLCT